MEFSQTKNDSCQHEQYCDLSKTVCEEEDFKEICRMKDSDINEMPLLKKVKESVEKREKFQD